MLSFKYMKPLKIVIKPPLIGAVFWILSIQYFIVQFIVALAWVEPYNLARNTISDLGNTACGNYHEHFVCSPLHSWMNASFVFLGISMIAGSALIYRQERKNLAVAIGFGCLILAGSGTALVGLFPENTISAIHILGAALSFLIGNLALLILGYSLKLPSWLRCYTIASGIIALTALGLFITSNYLHLGIGGMERLTAYPQTICLIIFGVWRALRKSRSINP